jgi:carboxypeptidase T
MKVSANPSQNDPEPEIAFLGVHHARELITALHSLRLLHTLTDNYATDSNVRNLVDTREVWVIPVVNPNGYERAVGNQVDWRKNTRLATQSQIRCGVDLNRNYAFGHVTVFPPAIRATLPDVDRSGVDPSTGNLMPDYESYPGPSSFSEVETQAVRGLAHSQFLTREEVDGLVCMLDWHSLGGVVGHPMGHPPQPPTTGLDPPDVGPFGHLTLAMANAAAYVDVKDGFSGLSTVNGCPYQGFHVYGDSID